MNSNETNAGVSPVLSTGGLAGAVDETAVAAGISAEQYEAAIPECCAYQGLQAHMDCLMLCWGLTAAIEAGKPMDCTGCEMATRKPAYK